MTALRCRRAGGWALAMATFACLAGAADRAITDFRAADNAAGWEVKSLGDGKARWQNDAGRPMLLAATTPQSWIYLVRNYWDKDLAGAERVRFSAWVCSNQPEKPLYVISEGASWGEAIDRSERASGRQAMVWERVVVELERRPGKMVSVALGLDYFRDGAWVAVDRARIETARAGEAFPPLDDDPPEAPFALSDEEAAWFGAGADPDTLVWRPAGPLEAFTADTAFAADGPARVRLDAPRNARESLTLLIANRSDTPQGARLAVDGAWGDAATLARYACIEGAPDLPLPLPAGGWLEIGRRQCVGIELAFDTAKLPPGVHAGNVTITPLAGKLPVKTMAVELEVHPVELPDRMPLSVFNWDYGWARDPARRDFLLAARVNVFQAPFFNREQAERFEGLDELVARLRERLEPGAFQVLVEVWHIREQKEWRPEDHAWLDRLAARMESLGLGYEDWLFQTHDETLSDEFLDVCRAIKAHNPKVRLFSDCLVRDPAVMRRFADAVDLWCPIAGLLLDPSYADALAVVRASGHPLWAYTCDAAPGQDPAFYRRQGWLAHHAGLDGTAFWTVKNASWRDTPGRPNFGINYLDAEDRMLASRRWNQWRAGLEDYLLLHLAAERGDPALTKRIGEWEKRVLGAERGQLDAAIAEARREILTALSRQP